MISIIFRQGLLGWGAVATIAMSSVEEEGDGKTEEKEGYFAKVS